MLETSSQRVNSIFDSAFIKAGEMIARSSLRCTAARGLLAGKPRTLRPRYRRYSTTSGIQSIDGASPAAMLGAFTNELDKIAPRFDILGSQIKIIRSPSDFYETLKVGEHEFNIAQRNADCR